MQVWPPTLNGVQYSFPLEIYAMSAYSDLWI